MIEPIQFPEKPSQCGSREAFGGPSGWVVFYNVPTRTWMNWFILEVADSNPLLFRSIDYIHPTADPDDGAVFAHGSIKWDGCIDFTVGDERHSIHRHHVCDGASGMRKIADMLLSIPELAKRVIPSWDGDAQGGD